MTATMHKHLIITMAMLALTWAWLAPASGQVRTEPQGNTLESDAPQGPPRLPAMSPQPPRAASLDAQSHAAFEQKVNLGAFRRLAVFEGGRTKIIDTLARESVERIYGRSAYRDLETRHRYDPVFTWLDLLLNKPYYFHKPLIHVEVLPLRQAMVTPLPADQQELWLKRGRLAPAMFSDPHLQDILNGADADLRLSKGRNQVLRAIFAFQQNEQDLHLVSPPADSEYWASLAELHDTRVAAAADGDFITTKLKVENPQAAQQAMQHLESLRSAWRNADAVAVNLALDGLVQTLPLLNPHSYPTSFHRNLEYVYNATHKFTIGYVGYFLGLVALLIAFAVRRGTVVRLGVALLLVGFGVHTAGILSRAVLSGRWPIHNQYESFIAVSWLGVLVGILIMWKARQSLFGAAAAALGTCALVFANTVEIPSREMGQVAGILATSRILYVHVNMVLASYGLIGLGFFISLIYLMAHYFQGKQAVQVAAAGLGAIDAGDDAPLPGRQALLRDLDHAQMVALQLAFWILGVGILLGAYWADHAWGRWWAWDPKETWALITWIVYLITIHVRFGVQQRGLVTAWLSVIGFFVMLWTYWGVNLLLAGLHSYA
jgi:cytochrome c-type biogenesis protein CcsB